jgi:UDP-3-O-[3-hydroxymyristoyl] glucosamine N-acyltransferase
VNHQTPFTPKEGITYIITKKDAKLQLSLIMKEFFAPSAEYYLVNETDKHRLNKDIKIGDHVFIGQNVTIGNGSVIYPFAVIEADSIIGENCVIKPHTSIGSEGIGIALNEETKLYEKLPQIGHVVLGDHVDVGPNATIRRGALGQTIIGDGSKIGANVNVGHNCIFGVNAFLTANISTGGSSILGDNVYLGMNASVKNGITIGNNAQIGMGAVVTKSVPDGMIAFGNPAKVIRERKDLKT